MRRSHGCFECVLCGAELPAISVGRVRKVLVRREGPGTQRVVLVDGLEVHRCTLRHPVGSHRP